MGIMDMFKPAAPAPQPANPAAPTGGTTVPADQKTPEGSIPGSKQEPVNPMDSYSKLFDNSATPNVAPTFAIDQKILADAAGSMDFTLGIPQELMAKATGGDADALIKMMNLVGRNAYQHSLSHTSALTDRFVAQRSEFDLKGIDAKVTQKLTNSALANSPNYAHPTVRAEFTRVANAFQAQHPDSSPDEIATATKKYMTDLHNAMNPATETPADKAAKGTDWDDWMTS
jgi:hypothetical protein